MAESITKGRISYLDIAKGILILFLMLHHSTPRQVGLKDYHMEAIENVDYLVVFYGPFFMAAFFLISGYCTNFEKELGAFICSSIKGIVLPAITFTIISSIVGSIIQSSLSPIISLFSSGFWLYPCGFWFFAALFEARLVLWFFARCRKKYGLSRIVLLCITFVVGFGGLLLNKRGDTPIYCSILAYQQGMFALPFLSLGYFYRNELNIRIIKISSAIFIVLLSVLFLMDKPTPTWTFVMSMKVHHYPLFVLLALTGSSLIVLLSRIIMYNRHLEFVGRNSLIFYSLNFIVVDICGWLLSKTPINLENPYHCYLWVTLMVFMGMSLLTLFSILLDKKGLRCLIGRF